MGKISKAWRQMVEKLDFSPLQVIWGHTNSKHMVSFRGLKFGLSIPRAQELYMFSLHTLKDL
jgi:hypothetical protein